MKKTTEIIYICCSIEIEKLKLEAAFFAKPQLKYKAKNKLKCNSRKSAIRWNAAFNCFLVLIYKFSSSFPPA